MIVEALYYFLPAYISNTTPPLFKWFKFLDIPIDFGYEIKGKRLFGAHKTIRGFLLACIIGTLIFYIQKSLYQYPFFASISLIDYSKYGILLGFLLSFGAIFGDLIESFIKRRINIEPGKTWFPFDQLDFVIGAFLFSFIIFIPNVWVIVIIVILSPLFQMIFHYLGYKLKINNEKL